MRFLLIFLLVEKPESFVDYSLNFFSAIVRPTCLVMVLVLLCSCASVPRINEPFGIDVMPTVSQLRAIARHTYYNIRPRSWAPDSVTLPEDTQYRVLFDGGYGTCTAWAATNHETVLRIWPGMVGKVWVWYVHVSSGARHAVAVVEIDGKKYVLDNLTSELRIMDDVDYLWVRWSLNRRDWVFLRTVVIE